MEENNSLDQSLEENGAFSLKLNPDDYRQYLAEYNMTKEQENEFLEALWRITSILVDKELGIDSIHLIESSMVTDINKKVE